MGESAVTDSIAELYSEVYAHPDDDQVRRVLADALLALGDPRGELILFQLEPDKDYHRRAMRLVQQHGLTWLGPLRDAVIPLGYERGFLAHCQLVGGAAIDFTLEEWGTVHTIDAGKRGPHEPFDVTPAMRALKRVKGLSMTSAARITAADPSLAARLNLGMKGEPSQDHYDPTDE